jgi:hypothetical protein
MYEIMVVRLVCWQIALFDAPIWFQSFQTPGCALHLDNKVHRLKKLVGEQPFLIGASVNVSSSPARVSESV